MTRVVVSNVSIKIPDNGLRNFLGMNVSPVHCRATLSRVQNGFGKQSDSAIFECSDELVQELLSFNGAELDGRTI